MQYSQLDRIIDLEPGERLVAERTLQPDEEYLRDHFPNFPVMPGVMMLETLTQAATWMIHAGDDFASPLLLVHEVRNVKFSDFLAPHQTLQVATTKMKEVDGIITVKGEASKEGRTSVSARILLRRDEYQVEDGGLRNAEIRRRTKKKFTELFGDILSPTTKST